MLVEFSVENFLSFRKRVSLSLVKCQGEEWARTNTISHDVPSTPSLLRSVAIYGPNAGGKSNLIKAMQFMRYMVLRSATEMQSGDSISVTPFLLDEYCVSNPSVFEIHFISDNVRYQYGFAATRERITEEWLFAYPKGRPQRWIDRQFNENGEYIWGKTDKLVGKKQLWQNSTRSNALYLSTAIQLNNQQLQPVFDWFFRIFNVLRVGNVLWPGEWVRNISIELCEHEEKKNKVMNFLRATSVGFEDIELEKEEIDFRRIPKEFSEPLRAQLEKEFNNQFYYSVKTIHVDVSNNKVVFDLRDESDGTQKLFVLSGPWLEALEHGYVLAVDDLHDQLHPLILKFLVNLFHNKDTGNAQLVFTTHDTTVLDSNTLRRDQIWFCEKNESRATELIPLTDFKPRKKVENLRKGYLSGRYGGLPHVGRHEDNSGAVSGQ